MSINGLRRLARATSMAAVIAAASGVPETTGLPLSAAVDDAALKFGTVQSERERLRRKVMGAPILIANSAARTRLEPHVALA
jgi:hypothetical protein